MESALKRISKISQELKTRQATKAEAEATEVEVEVEAALWDILKSKNPDGDLHGEYHNKPINHPGRYQLLQYFDYHCAAATPPSKGGESIIN